MARVFNFSAGPAVLPEAVLKQAADEMLDYGGTGTSVMEMSHRSKAFIGIHARAEGRAANSASQAVSPGRWLRHSRSANRKSR